MADSEVRQKFEATVKGICEILNEWRRGTGPGIATLLMMAWDEAFEAGMRAGEIAMREKAANEAISELYGHDTGEMGNRIVDAIRELAISGAEESKK